DSLACQLDEHRFTGGLREDKGNDAAHSMDWVPRELHASWVLGVEFFEDPFDQVWTEICTKARFTLCGRCLQSHGDAHGGRRIFGSRPHSPLLPTTVQQWHKAMLGR